MKKNGLARFYDPWMDKVLLGFIERKTGEKPRIVKRTPALLFIAVGEVTIRVETQAWTAACMAGMDSAIQMLNAFLPAELHKRRAA